MKSLVTTATAVMIASLVFMGCNCSSKSNESSKRQDDQKVVSVGAACPVSAGGGNVSSPGAVCPAQESGKSVAAAHGIAAGHETIEGTVIQTLSAGRYVYIEVDTKAGPVWVAAVARQPVARGDKFSSPKGMMMEKFNSTSLKRTFERIYFIESMTVTPIGAK